VICPPPSDVMFPPETAVVPVIEVTEVVDTVASTISPEVNDTWLP
jgi:hypothetical protein